MARHYNFIYEKLVSNDGDMVGRIAYSLYKREKIAFVKQYKEIWTALAEFFNSLAQ